MITAVLFLSCARGPSPSSASVAVLPVLEIRRENRLYDVAPKIVPANKEAEIVITPLSLEARFDDNQEYVIRILAVEGYQDPQGRSGLTEFEARPIQSGFRFNRYWHSEQEHVIRIGLYKDKKFTSLADLRIYSLESDLFERYPFRGDLHMHSQYSDGRKTPAYIAAICRRNGLDFMALTDHGKYAPSLEAINAYSDVKLDLVMVPGEEIHPPKNDVHLVNFGGSPSVSALIKDSTAHKEQVGTILEGLKNLPPDADPYTCASVVWVCDRIREAGGLSIFCHPYWIPGVQHNSPGPVTDFLLEQKPFDLLEIVNDCGHQDNFLMAMRYNEELLKNRRMPLVGSSDSHDCDAEGGQGWSSTIAFAPGPEYSDLRQSLLDGYSVAIEWLPGEKPRFFGPFRLVKYMVFLWSEVLPQHNDLCFEEGQLMLRYANGEKGVKVELERCSGRVAALYQKYWGK
jgi:predicted metal-dependent phosphoesterase TrpH